MSDDRLLFQELRSLSQSDSGRQRICLAVVSRGVAGFGDAETLRVAVLATMPYRVYLLTEHWRTMAQDAKVRAKFRCQLCNGGERIETHHRTYERRGCELPEDLTVLCDDCHGKHHSRITNTPTDEPGAVDADEIRFAGMTDEEQLVCLTQLIARKRQEQAIGMELMIPRTVTDLATSNQRSTSSAASSLTQKG